MSDVLIRGMEMPKNCGACYLNHGEFCFMLCRKLNIPQEWEARPSNCPLVELPAHGDLILKDDAIVAVKLLSDLYPEYRKILAVLWDQIKDLTVIIPESEEVTNDPQP